jgi:hypothetical protein
MKNHEDAVQLWDSDTVGLIVLDETGVRYTNQVGGTACGHPVATGFYVPLRLHSEIPVTITSTDAGLLPDSFVGRAAILTYPNSD